MSKAIGLYALLAYDVSDFADSVNETSDIQVLQDLHLMLTLPNEKHSEDTRELNLFGAPIVQRRLHALGVKPRVFVQTALSN